MFNFDKVDLQRVAVSSVGAVALSAACIFGVAGPARAAAPIQNAHDWQAVVEKQLDAAAPALAQDDGTVSETKVAVRFDADGRYAGASVLRSSGDRALDKGALKAASELAYPALPAGYRQVTVRILHGASVPTIAAARVQDHKVVQYASVAGGSAFKANVK